MAATVAAIAPAPADDLYDPALRQGGDSGNAGKDPRNTGASIGDADASIGNGAVYQDAVFPMSGDTEFAGAFIMSEKNE